MEVVEKCCQLQAVEMKRRAEEIFERVSYLNNTNTDNDDHIDTHTHTDL